MAIILTLGLSGLLSLVYLRLAAAKRWVDIPNERSSHEAPTPSGGGVALVCALVIGCVYAQSALPGSPEMAWDTHYWVMLAVSFGLCMLGAVDDLRGLSVKLRFVFYAVACIGCTWLLLGGSRFGDGLVSVGLVLFVAFAILWLVNLYNFMDGIDGIAALETVSVALAAAVLASASGASHEYVGFVVLLAAAHAGFLAVNWPPAKLFMGDAGSVTTGFLLGALALMGTVRGELHPLVWIILLAGFITDATWTLMRRLVSGEPFTQPHRSHAYQRLSRHFGSHRSVDFLLVAFNLAWLTPLAYAVLVWPQHGLILVILAYLPLLVGMAKIGRFP